MSNSQGQSFNQVLIQSIDDSLQVLGEEPRLAVYQYLSTINSLDKDDIPERLDDFTNGLRSALGGASKVIERLILRHLFQKIGSTYRDSSDYEFADHVREAKRRFENQTLKPRQTTKEQQAEHPKLKKAQPTS